MMKNLKPLLTSQRLNFFALTKEHIEEFCQMDMDSEVMKHYTSRPHGTRDQAIQSFNRYMDYMKLHPKLGGFMAFKKETNEFVGLGVLIHLELNPKNKAHEVGYRLPVHMWGKGYATEIAKTLIDYGFNELNFTEILGTTNPDNKTSEKVLLKCGLKFIGRIDNYGGSNSFKITKSV